MQNLYNKDKTKLITAFLAGEELTELAIPDTVREVESRAFVGNPNLERIIGGEKVTGRRVGGVSPKFNPYTDTYHHWSKEAVKWGYQNGVVNGVAPFRFQPDGKVTRAMFTTILYNEQCISGSPEYSILDFLKYADVPENRGIYYYRPLQWVTQNGIVNGVGDNRFAPEQNVTREQMATMIYRFVQKAKETRYCYSGLDEDDVYHRYWYKLSYNPDAKGDVSVFTDADKISSYAEEAMSWAVGAGILQGKNSGRLDPRGTATRAEAVTMMQRLQSLAEEFDIETSV